MVIRGLVCDGHRGSIVGIEALVCGRHRGLIVDGPWSVVDTGGR